MKKLIFIITGFVILTSCATSKVKESAKNESAGTKNIFLQAEIKHAIEMRRFLIKFDRLYISHGGTIDLIPKSNYLILDGDKVIISAAYAGRQYSYRPVAGIDMIGRAVSFEVKNKTEKGLYEIKMKVRNDKNTFDVFVTITNSGYCDTSLASYKIDHVRYTGNFIPLKPKMEKIDTEIVVI
ncbi:MAG: DUF4251 domain-containing protein [Bacteroidales bacterium]|nr:DUF4251 domain-containing protein [Bacteroidales bacterium]MBK8882441.1 DUF4251 domain-containing protein [Bacteroidales bacterium]